MTASPPSAASDTCDVVLVGGGIMSANLGAILKGLDPRLSIRVLEVGAEPAREASDGWNNAGTGHAGLCEISYTPSRDTDGGVSIGRVLNIFEQFEHSKQFWAHAAASGMVGDPADCIQSVPHICFVQGAADVGLLEARFAAMRRHHFFRSMEFTTDPAVVGGWAPLVMEGRGTGPIAATRSAGGTEVHFGLLARRLFAWLDRQEGCAVTTACRATRLARDGHGWRIDVTHLPSGERGVVRAKFVFVGAGGGTLRLLQSSGLPEAAGLGGFPIGGQWLACDAPAIVGRHDAKVYGAVAPESPSLGAGHLDIRRLDGRPRLLFGPFASWTTRFLKNNGHWSDLPRSLAVDNASTLVRVAWRNWPLVRYLVGQALQGMGGRMAALRQFYPLARAEDWRIVQAGIRVQAIRRADRGAISFGTQLFSADDRTLAAVLGASPGASVSVNIALETVKTCLPHLLGTTAGRDRMVRMIPTFDIDLKRPENAPRFAAATGEADETLGLQGPTTPPYRGG